jgi:hypothetical protein
LIEPYYVARGHAAWLDQLQSWYADENPRFFSSVKEAQGAGRYYFEYVSYHLVWVIPGVLLLAGFVGLRYRGRKPRQS